MSLVSLQWQGAPSTTEVSSDSLILQHKYYYFCKTDAFFTPENISNTIEFLYDFRVLPKFYKKYPHLRVSLNSYYDINGTLFI